MDNFLPFESSGELQANAEYVLVTGDRYWDSEEICRRELLLCASMKELSHGAAKGADSICAKIATGLIGEESVKAFPAEWEKYRQLGRVRAAGPIRNRQMLQHMLERLKLGSVFVLAFHRQIQESKGTRDMVRISQRAGLPVKLITE